MVMEGYLSYFTWILFYFQAVCCKDDKHCCPFKTTCDEIKHNCKYRGISISWVEKTEAISLDKEDNSNVGERKENLMSVVCPDGQHMCEAGQSCCKNNNGYACCPFKNVNITILFSILLHLLCSGAQSTR